MATTAKPTMAEVKAAIRTILSDRAHYGTSLNYAVNYADYALGIDDEHELKVQCLYVLGNITHWRHEKAKEVRATLKAYAH